MKKPIIGISSSTIIEKEEAVFLGYKRTYVNDDYIDAVVRAGGIPVVLPMLDSDEDIKELVESLDGLVLMGGHDIDPILYNEEPCAKIGELYPKRDKVDSAWIKAAFDKKIPILGVCRGLQLLNVVFGGSLYQDLSFIEGCNVDHIQKGRFYEPVHFIDVKEGTRFHSLVGDVMRVNSFHHLAVKDLAKDFVISAVSRDNVVEAIEYDGDQFVLGVQFHPEMMSPKSEQAENIFRGFIKEASERMM